MANWNRQYRFIVKPTEGSGFELGEPNEDGLATHIQFNIEKTAAYGESGSVNSVIIRLWNLTDDQISIIRNGVCSFTLRAGYGDDLYTIFSGTMKKVEESLDSADRQIVIEGVDTNYFIRNTTVTLSYSKAVTAQTVLDDLLAQISLPVIYSASAQALLSNRKFARGYSFAGQVEELLDNICNVAYELTWKISSGVLYIRYKNESTSTYVHLLSADTGLINVPTYGYSNDVTNDDSSEEVLWYYEVDYLLNGAIEVGSYVQLISKVVEGTFYVNSLSISGDNLEGDWLCTAKVTESSASTADKKANEES